MDHFDISKENDDIISTSHACDVKYFNTLLLEQFPKLQFHVIKCMHLPFSKHVQFMTYFFKAEAHAAW